MMHTSGGSLLIVLVVLTEARPGRILGWLIGWFRCFILLPSGERSSPLWCPLMSRSSLWCSPLVPVVHQSWGLIIPVTAAVLERSTLASPPLLLFWFHALFSRRALATAAVGASPPWLILLLIHMWNRSNENFAWSSHPKKEAAQHTVAQLACKH